MTSPDFSIPDSKTQLNTALEILTVSEQSELTENESVIERGLKTFHEVGNALLSIRDKRLYRQDFKTFEEYCDKKWQLERRRAYQLIDAANVYENVKNFSQPPIIESHTKPLTKLEPEEQRLVWDIVQKTAPGGKVTADHVKSVANVFKEVSTTKAIDDGSGIQVAVSDVFKAAVTEETYERMKRQEVYIAEKIANKQAAGVPLALQSSSSNEWYTPADYIEAARTLMGGIDTDPASNPIANQTVKALQYYTIETNGFDKNWMGRVWLNPPYGREDGDSNQDKWSARLIEQYLKGYTSEAVLLVNAVTDRKWFQPLWDYPICFTDHRIKFKTPTGEAGQPTHGNCFVYLGKQHNRFVELFSAFGVVVTRVVPQSIELPSAA